MFFEAVSPSMRAVEAVMRELAQSEVPVLLLGEVGSGKRTTAERIHQMSRRNSQTFRVIDCESPALELFETSLESVFQAGTVLLAEITALYPACQAKLLETLPKCGGNGRTQVMEARLIFGSSRDLATEVKAGRLREDLYYRISGVCLRLPPLRQRKEDIPRLVEHFLLKYGEEFRRPVPKLSSEMERLFLDYSWPGNLRELESAARVLVALGDEHLAMGGLRALLRQPSEAGNGNRLSLKAAAKAASHQAERELILKVLTRTRWNRRRAAAELQISYKALLYKLKQIGCEGYGTS